MIRSDAFSNLCYMNFICNLSMQHNVIIISYKNITYWADFFSYIMKDTYYIIWKIRFLDDLSVDGIFERVGLQNMNLPEITGGSGKFWSGIFSGDWAFLKFCGGWLFFRGLYLLGGTWYFLAHKL